MKTYILKVMAVIIVCCTMFSACKKDRYGSLAVKMTDSPGNYVQVNVEITQVQMHYDNGADWVNLNVNSGVYNLLTLQNNVMVLLASGTHLAASKVSQLRLILGTNNTVMYHTPA